MAKEPKRIKYGSVTVNAWENEGKYGKYHNFSIQRSYKDEKGDWQNTDSLRVNDIPDVIMALQEAYTMDRKKIVLPKE